MKVSVAMITYNHEAYIAQAVESVLMQQTKFPMELVIGEDYSTDRTGEIVRKLASEHPESIRLLPREGNIGMIANFFDTIQACQGKYVALLEGDDYWTDPLKIQKQVDFLESHPECTSCFHDATVIYDNSPVTHSYGIKVKKPVYTLADFLLGHAHIPTCSTLFINGLFNTPPAWCHRLAMGDSPVHIFNAQHGNIGYIDESMAVYRRHKGGIWSAGFSTSSMPTKVTVARFQSLLEFYETVNDYLHFEYDAILRLRISESCYDLVWAHQCLGDRKSMRKYLRKAFRTKFRHPRVPLKFIIKATIVAFLPFAYCFTRCHTGRK